MAKGISGVNNTQKHEQKQLVNWLLGAILSALVTLTAMVFADDDTDMFADTDGADITVTTDLRIIINLNRKIAVTEMVPGNMLLKRSGADGFANETKGYCVRANYDGTAGLRIRSKNSTSAGGFVLQNDEKDIVPITVMVHDVLAGGSPNAIHPNKDLVIRTQREECTSATTNLEVSADFKNIKEGSGRYETTLALTFIAQ